MPHVESQIIIAHQMLMNSLTTDDRSELGPTEVTGIGLTLAGSYLTSISQASDMGPRPATRSSTTACPQNTVQQQHVHQDSTPNTQTLTSIA